MKGQTVGFINDEYFSYSWISKENISSGSNHVLGSENGFLFEKVKVLPRRSRGIQVCNVGCKTMQDYISHRNSVKVCLWSESIWFEGGPKSFSCRSECS